LGQAGGGVILREGGGRDTGMKMRKKESNKCIQGQGQWLEKKAILVNIRDG